MGDKAEVIIFQKILQDIKSLVNQCNQLLSPVIEIVNKSTAKGKNIILNIVKSSEINAAINSLVTYRFLTILEQILKYFWT